LHPLLIRRFDVQSDREPAQDIYPPWVEPHAEEHAMTPNDVRRVIERARQSWIDGDGVAFAELFTSDGEFIAPGKRWRGHDAIRDVTDHFASKNSDVHIDIRRIIVDGDQAVIEWFWRCTVDATGALDIADDAIVVDFKEGLITRWREYIDTKTPAAPATG
jgi:uncharacterized protein (TIGR02246 family)